LYSLASRAARSLLDFAEKSDVPDRDYGLVGEVVTNSIAFSVNGRSWNV
jgi:hypothetical protein